MKIHHTPRGNRKRKGLPYMEVRLNRNIPTDMQYLFTCVNTSVPESLAVKFVKCIVPGNSRNARLGSRLLDPACASISALSLISRSRCASGSPLCSMKIRKVN